MHPSPPPPNRVGAFFDIDGTLIRGATSWLLARDLYARKFFGVRDIAFAARHALRFLIFGENNENLEAVRARALAAVKGRLEAEIALIGEELFVHALQERVFPGTMRLIERHLAAGHEVWLVSATPDQVARQVARGLGVTGGRGTLVDVDERGVLTGTMPGELLHGPHKAEAVKQLAATRGLDLAASFAYSDSVNDARLLSLVGHPAAVNPEPALRRLAKRRSWPIYDFSRRRPDVALAARKSLLSAEMMGGAWATFVVLQQTGIHLRRLGLLLWRRPRQVLRYWGLKGARLQARTKKEES